MVQTEMFRPKLGLETLRSIVAQLKSDVRSGSHSKLGPTCKQALRTKLSHMAWAVSSFPQRGGKAAAARRPYPTSRFSTAPPLSPSRPLGWALQRSKCHVISLSRSHLFFSHLALLPALPPPRLLVDYRWCECGATKPSC